MRYITQIDQLEYLSETEKEELRSVTEQFAFRCNEYYLSLINWDDPDDPIRRIIIPDIHELEEWGRFDPSDEKTYCVIPGLEHKYNSTVLLLVSMFVMGSAATVSVNVFLRILRTNVSMICRRQLNISNNIPMLPMCC